MYAERFAERPRFRPASLGAALAINGGVVAALLLASPDLVRRIVPPPIKIVNIDPIPEPEPTAKPELRKAQPQPRPTTPAAVPTPTVDTLKPADNILTREPGTGEPAGAGNGAIERSVDPPIPPLFVAAREDPRYLPDFQPPYPDYERDAGREDVVKLRIRIGVDGRVKQVERLAGRDSFARVSIAHALAKWRFKPATRGGVPEESWKLMTLRFTLNG